MKVLWITNIALPEAKSLLKGNGTLKSGGARMQDSLAEASVFVEVVDFFRNKRLKSQNSD